MYTKYTFHELKIGCYYVDSAGIAFKILSYDKTAHIVTYLMCDGTTDTAYCITNGDYNGVEETRPLEEIPALAGLIKVGE